MRPRRIALAAIAASLVCLPFPAAPGSSVVAAPAYRWNLPRGFPTPAVPADNPMSAPKVSLGRRLFFEPRLSITGTYSCATCHDPARAFTDGRGVALGATGESTANGAMALVNVAYNTSYGWTRPEVRTLEAQMLQPLLNEHPVELGIRGREEQVASFLSADADYRAAFAAAFPHSGGRATFDLMVKAIAAFERTLISGHSAFDRYVFDGQHDALSPAARRGMALFYSSRLGCSACHSGFNFAGNWRDAQGATGEPSFAMNGTGSVPMRVPTLRNVAVTAPYMHNGRFSTLAAVVAHYERAGRREGEPRAGRQEPHVRPFTLDASERVDLVAFLESLTDPEFLAQFR